MEIAILNHDHFNETFLPGSESSNRVLRELHALTFPIDYEGCGPNDKKIVVSYDDWGDAIFDVVAEYHAESIPGEGKLVLEFDTTAK